eukprot:6115289-Pyramimonas_sp.AAC.1
MTETQLAVGSPGDDMMGVQAGAVYIYPRSPSEEPLKRPRLPSVSHGAPRAKVHTRGPLSSSRFTGVRCIPLDFILP